MSSLVMGGIREKEYHPRSDSEYFGARHVLSFEGLFPFSYRQFQSSVSTWGSFFSGTIGTGALGSTPKSKENRKIITPPARHLTQNGGVHSAVYAKRILDEITAAWASQGGRGRTGRNRPRSAKCSEIAKRPSINGGGAGNWTRVRRPITFSNYMCSLSIQSRNILWQQTAEVKSLNDFNLG